MTKHDFETHRSDIEAIIAQVTAPDFPLWKIDMGSPPPGTDESVNRVVLKDGKVLRKLGRGSTRSVWEWEGFVIKFGMYSSSDYAEDDYESPNYVEHYVYNKVMGTSVEKLFAPMFAYYATDTDVYDWRPGLLDIVVTAKFKPATYGDPQYMGSFNGQISTAIQAAEPHLLEEFKPYDLCGFNLAFDPEMVVIDYGGFQLS